MRKALVGIVALVGTVVGVSACETKNNAGAKAPAAQSSSGVMQKIADVKPSGSGALSMPGSQPETLEATPKPRFTLVLGEGKGGFKFRSAGLSDETKAKIDAMFGDEGIDMTDAHFEIEGYTDNLGSKQVNDQVGLARAEAVRQYLNEQHEIALDRVGVISYGMDKPVADNATSEGRAMNRRVVVKVVD